VDAAAFFARLGLPAADLKPGNLGVVFQGGGRRISLDADEREAELDGLRVFLGDPALLRARRFYVSRVDVEKLLGPLLAPTAIPGPPRSPPRVIVLDPGHGGEDSGTQNKPQRLDEKTFTLDVAQRLKKLLEAAGHRVVLTRDRDVFIPLPERAAIANRERADLFLSIHFNAVANGPAVDGIETYLMTPQSQRSTASAASERADDTALPGNAFDPWNAVLGAALHRRLVTALGADDRGLKHARFAVLQRLTTAPGVLVECGYLSNDAEARRIATPAHRQKIAQALADGVAAYSAALAAPRQP
jgi:N-acetylmuramoyl-L-alanine amidase